MLLPCLNYIRPCLPSYKQTLFLAEIDEASCHIGAAHTNEIEGASSQQSSKNGALSSTTCKGLNPANNYLSSEADSSPVEASDGPEPWVTPWMKACEILWEDPAKLCQIPEPRSLEIIRMFSFKPLHLWNFLHSDR